MHEAEAEALGLRYVYQLVDLNDLDLGPGDIRDLLLYARRLGFRGLNVTHPWKQLVLRHLDDLSPEAAAIGAVNTIVFDEGRAIGHNTDAAGFRQSFEVGFPDAVIDDVLVLGAGGAGAAVAYAALVLGTKHVVVVDIDEDRATALSERLGQAFDRERVSAAPANQLSDLLSRATGLIHATPCGMAAHPTMAFSPGLLHAGLWVADIVYRPLETELLQRAQLLGCRTLDGGGMAVFQAVDAFHLFTGLRPDSARMMNYFAQTFRADLSFSDDDRELPIPSSP